MLLAPVKHGSTGTALSSISFSLDFCPSGFNTSSDSFVFLTKFLWPVDMFIICYNVSGFVGLFLSHCSVMLILSFFVGGLCIIDDFPD